jgi:hypothetical protein
MARKAADRSKGRSVRLRANRENEKGSTDPRSAAGKAKSAANALPNGLATPAGAVAELGPPIALLARHLAGKGAGAGVRQCAALAALAGIDLARIRAARDRLLRSVEATLAAAGGRGGVDPLDRGVRGGDAGAWP